MHSLLLRWITAAADWRQQKLTLKNAPCVITLKQWLVLIRCQLLHRADLIARIQMIRYCCPSHCFMSNRLEALWTHRESNAIGTSSIDYECKSTVQRKQRVLRLAKWSTYQKLLALIILLNKLGNFYQIWHWTFSCHRWKHFQKSEHRVCVGLKTTNY